VKCLRSPSSATRKSHADRYGWLRLFFRRPLGRGLLTGKLSRDALSRRCSLSKPFAHLINITVIADDRRRHLSRFQEDVSYHIPSQIFPLTGLIIPCGKNWAHNAKIVDILSAIATKKGVTTAQLCLAWVSSLGPRVMPLPGSSCV
jgi:aryl-alcohol dehydrogenase-like predicted oxidoreductase